MKISRKLPALCACAWLLACASAGALTVSEDFLYPSLTTGDSLANNADGGTGWNGGWEGNPAIFFHETINLEGTQFYQLEQEVGSGSLYSNAAHYRAITRTLAKPVSGEIWFSFLFRKGGASGGLMFNADRSHATSAPGEWGILVDDEGHLTVRAGGETTQIAQLGNAIDYLVVGRLVTGEKGSLEVWLNPNLNGISRVDEFLSSGQDPVFSRSETSLPSALESLGIAAYRGQGGGSVFRFDALRLSDGDGDANAAYQAISAIP